jgi:hypothetical protein
MADLLTTINQVRNVLSSLSRDVDPNDSQDEMAGNLKGLDLGFSELGTILTNMEASDATALMKEYGDIFAGREGFTKNLQDISKILNNIRSRAKGDSSVKGKIESQFPSARKEHNVDSLIDDYESTLKRLQALQSKIEARAA